MLKKIWKFIVDSVTPSRQEPVMVKAHCNKHNKYKKGCPVCRGLNNGT